jgi:hypothetical protein
MVVLQPPEGASAGQMARFSVFQKKKEMGSS